MVGLIHKQVLVLNRLWQPVNTCSARRAFSLLFLGHAQVVRADGSNNFYTHDFDSWTEFSRREPAREMARTVSLCLRVPKIIVLSLFDRLPKKDVKFTRENIFRRDKFTCQYCGTPFGQPDLNLDHVVPRCRGGETTWENVVSSCIPCNSRKGNKLPHEVNMHPIQSPHMPKWRPFFGFKPYGRPHTSWRHFLDLDHSAVELSE